MSDKIRTRMTSIIAQNASIAYNRACAPTLCRHAGKAGGSDRGWLDESRSLTAWRFAPGAFDAMLPLVYDPTIAFLVCPVAPKDPTLPINHFAKHAAQTREIQTETCTHA